MEQPLQDNKQEPLTNNQEQGKQPTKEKTGVKSFFMGLGVSVLGPTVLLTPVSFLFSYLNEPITTVISLSISILAYIVIPVLLWKKWHFRLGMLILGMLAPSALGILAFGACLLTYGSSLGI